HNELVRKIINEFAPRFIPNGQVIYVGDTGSKWAYYDKEGLKKL
ncbi:MAG: restriction endonuclease, partial [Candidatus Thorarchaeota archaeon]|nr:restriction endonuclease [Candidatus Thorarchaeota archaeon]